jgi:predicted amidohydrolase YtcJ
MAHLHYLLFALMLFLGCDLPDREGPDTIYHHGMIYTVDPQQPFVHALAVKDGKIISIGGNDEILTMAGTHTEVVDLNNRFVMPGLIEGHAHFLAIGENLKNLDLIQTTSWKEVLDKIAQRIQDLPPGHWATARGWHQDKWLSSPSDMVEGYPNHRTLSKLTKDNPLILSHASGHALMANQAAMDAAGVNAQTPDVAGGRIIRFPDGSPTGIFEENAMDLIQNAFRVYQNKRDPESVKMEQRESLLLAQDACFRQGITSFQDAGSPMPVLEHIKALTLADSLKIRLWMMLYAPFEDMEPSLKQLPWIGLGDDRLTVRGIKAYMDGALGSYGAWLLEDYADKPNYRGQILTSLDTLALMAELAFQHRMQFCIHAIGDQANRSVLDLFEETQKKNPESRDLRWRIEHAQHLDSTDIPRFAELGVYASMQPIHCISDAPFVEKRLGPDRTRIGAYVWRSLLDYGSPFAIGTDAPVESVNPFENIYAAITRRRMDNGQPFYPQQSMTRKEALYAYTLGNARAAFEEKTKGFLTPGKWADMIILSNHLLSCTDEELKKTRVLQTIIGGQVVYSNDAELR